MFALMMSIDAWWSDTAALTFPLLAATVSLGIWYLTLRSMLRAFVCPRCELPFFTKSDLSIGAGLGFHGHVPLHMVRACLHCELPKYHVPGPAAPSRRRRRLA